MKTIVFFLEERSAMALLESLLPRAFPDASAAFTFVPFDGKNDLERQLVTRIRGWRKPNTKFIVLRDQDAQDCQRVKQRLVDLCRRAGRPDTLVRIACRELESWYLGDLRAVEAALGLKNLVGLEAKVRYRNPDDLQGPADELKSLTGGRYSKVAGSRAIGAQLDISRNRSASFRVFCAAVAAAVSD